MRDPSGNQAAAVALTELRARWYARTGLQDLEDPQNPDAPLRRLGTHARVMRDKASRELAEVLAGDFDALADYYSAARAYADERQWPSRRERQIWLLHCEGASYRRIVRKLWPAKQRAWVGYHTVERVVRDVRAEVLGLRRPPARRGRPRIVGSRGKDALVVAARLDEGSQAALAALRERLKCSASTAIAVAIRFAASKQ